MAEFFERFTYYGMRAMLVLFLAAATAANPGFGIDGATAGAVYGLFTGGAYLLAIPGGWIADRLIGQRKAMFYGGVLIAIGNFILAIPATQPVFYSGVFVMVLGIGLLKPNVSAVVGALYEGQPGARRDAGFSIFYMGINLGAIVGPLVAAGMLGEKVNWRLGFVGCGVAMLLGTLLLSASRSATSGTPGLPPTVRSARGTQAHLDAAQRDRRVARPCSRSCCSRASIRRPRTQLALGLFVAAGRARRGLLRLRAVVRRHSTPRERKRVGVIIVFFFCAVLFWGGFEQQATTFNTFALEYTDRSLLGSWFADGQHPATWYQSINPWFIILFAPFFAWFWVCARRAQPGPFRAHQNGRGPGVPRRRVPGDDASPRSSWYPAAARSGPAWLLLAYLIHTFGELCLSPVGLSNVTKLSPPKFVEPHDGHLVPRLRHRQHHRGPASAANRARRRPRTCRTLPGDDADRRRRRRIHPAHLAQPARLDRRSQMNLTNYLRGGAAIATRRRACLLGCLQRQRGPAPPTENRGRRRSSNR